MCVKVKNMNIFGAFHAHFQKQTMAIHPKRTGIKASCNFKVVIIIIISL
jgi:hypothetical protein